MADQDTAVAIFKLLRQRTAAGEQYHRAKQIKRAVGISRSGAGTKRYSRIMKRLYRHGYVIRWGRAWKANPRSFVPEVRRTFRA
jgi:hypothetical protein